MNTYRINYSIGGEEVESTELTERNETAARKMFKTFCKSGTITSIELARENVCATKQQERDTLAAIIQMVEELGPQSYLKTAFSGCFEDAENNIEDDAAYSMKDRYEKAKEDIAYFQQAASTFSNDLDAARLEIERLKAEKDELARRIPAADDLTDCIALTEDRAGEHEQQMNEAAARIVELAAEPGSPEFQQAVTDHRNAKSALEYCKALQERLSRIVTAGA